jgi:hypothetical protein
MSVAFWESRAAQFERMLKERDERIDALQAELERYRVALERARDCEQAFVNKDGAHSATLAILNDALLNESRPEGRPS